MLLVAWHGLVVLALMPRVRLAAVPPAFESVLVRLETALAQTSPDKPRLRLSPAPDVFLSLPVTVPIEGFPGEAGSREALPAGNGAIDWNWAAEEAARSAGSALPLPDDLPRGLAESYWSRAHKKGEQVPVGPGKWLLWVTEHCYTLIDQMQPSAAGQAMVVRCPKRNAPIDADVLLKRRPQYLEMPVR